MNFFAKEKDAANDHHYQTAVARGICDGTFDSFQGGGHGDISDDAANSHYESGEEFTPIWPWLTKDAERENHEKSSPIKNDEKLPDVICDVGFDQNLLA